MFRGVNGQTQIQFLKKENFLYFTFLGEKKKKKKKKKGLMFLPESNITLVKNQVFPYQYQNLDMLWLK